MKIKTFLSASRLSIIALACIFTLGFTACSGDDDEPPVDELLSEKTTPIDFKLAEYYDRYQKFYLFDYAESKYIGTDTITGNKCTLDLRQGKHRIVWFEGLDDNTYYDPYWQYTKDKAKYRGGVHYDPETKIITAYPGDAISASGPAWIAYCEKDFEVYPYLMPVQNIRFDNYVTCDLKIEVTDIAESLAGNGQYLVDKYNGNTFIGKITGIPSVKSVSLSDNHYETQDGLELDVEARAKLNFIEYDKYVVEGVTIHIDNRWMLCPLNGINDLQLRVELSDLNGNPISSTALPKISLWRGYSTVMRGPLFSGSTADWTVAMEPYGE